jgi:hypothetical protein
VVRRPGVVLPWRINRVDERVCVRVRVSRVRRRSATSTRRRQPGSSQRLSSQSLANFPSLAPQFSRQSTARDSVGSLPLGPLLVSSRHRRLLLHDTRADCSERWAEKLTTAVNRNPQVSCKRWLETTASWCNPTRSTASCSIPLHCSPLSLMPTRSFLQWP